MKELQLHVGEVQRKISYWFNNVDLLTQAFTRRSYSEENGGANNEVLEFVGDRVLDFYVTKILMDRFGYLEAQKGNIEPEKDHEVFRVHTYTDEGQLTNLKKKLVNKKMLASRIQLLGLHEFLLMGNGDIQQQKENEDSVKEDLFEAILGAIAIDSNWNADELENAVSFMLDLDYFLTTGFPDDLDYVALIQQWNQKENGEIPTYEFQELSNGAYQATLVLQTARGIRSYLGQGSSKAEARNNGAEIAYLDLKDHHELFTILDEIPEPLTLDNAINTLQELAQKGYISMPQYHIPEEKEEDSLDRSKWSCTCEINSHFIKKTGYSKSKKIAKKYAAYLCICDICGLSNRFENDDL